MPNCVYNLPSHRSGNKKYTKLLPNDLGCINSKLAFYRRDGYVKAQRVRNIVERQSSKAMNIQTVASDKKTRVFTNSFYFIGKVRAFSKLFKN